MALHPQSILETLKSIRYPGTKEDIVARGMIDDIQIDGNKVHLSLLSGKANDPFIKSIVKAAEQLLARTFGDGIDIRGNITVKTRQAAPVETAPPLPQVKNILAVASGKGGVGKSTVSANLAVALARLGYRVGLLDADIHGPSIPKMFGEEDARPFLETIAGREWMMPVEKHGVKLMSIGFFVDKNEALVWRGTLAGNALKQLITEVYWGELDYLLLDLPPGTSDIHLTLVQTLAITGAVVVTTPQAVALADAAKAISMFTGEKVNVPVLGLVENMAWFTPAELPENKYYLFGKDGGKRLAAERNIALLGEIPLVAAICEGGDAGMPIAAADGVTGLAFSNLAQQVVAAVRYRNTHLEATARVKVAHR
ncbi:MAG: Mrp/NBP35 family ATP-binding protein [Dysgonamonadaceae bacterium]|jgi:ATP-binding protein involved in chromosome partitioning|nr:Mrp/NBP35 family ATP-binding protein [Dysgonamonadaceae bacterium]